MNLHTLIFTNNDCYKAGRKITVKGIMVHSTGANNSNLKRYVGPDDGLLGENIYGNYWNTPRPDGKEICPHAFIGKLKDGSIATYQVLPWDMRGWHCGSGSNGSANNSHIGFEICEDGLTDAGYLDKVYKEAVELCAYLCRQYNLNPQADGVIIDHSEGHARGIASNHSDVGNWWPKFGKSMDAFRADVAATLNNQPHGGGGTDGDNNNVQPDVGEIKIGDVVQFKGGPHYVSSNSTKDNGKPKAGPAKVTNISVGAKHPYHIIHTDDSSNVYGWVDVDSIGAASNSGSDDNKAQPDAGEIKIGDVVQFKGGPHYVSSNSTKDNGKPKAGPAKVTNISIGAKHPYHIIHTNAASNVYGWVDADKISKQ